MGRKSYIHLYLNKEVGKVKILEKLDIRDGRLFVKCECLICGRIFEAKFHNVYKGHYKSCGCLQHAEGNKSPRWEGVGEISLSVFKSLKWGAKKRNLEFSISLKDIWNLFLRQNRKCALSGVDIKFPERRAKHSGNASLDRINPSKGYTKDNIQWVHVDVNYMKQEMNNEEFLKWINLIYNNNK